MNWSARGNVLNQYLRNTSIGTTVKEFIILINIIFAYTICRCRIDVLEMYDVLEIMLQWHEINSIQTLTYIKVWEMGYLFKNR